MREGEGGFPLLLIHGWPETKRIWWRNVEPLAEAGFEVIVPDLRGFGDSGLAADDRYDAAAHARDMEALVRGELGHERVRRLRRRPRRRGGAGPVAALRGPRGPAGPVQHRSRRCCPTSTRRGVPREVPAWQAPTTSCARRATPTGWPRSSTRRSKRRRYVAQMYGPRFWAAPGAFDPRGRGLHDRAVRRRGALPRLDRQLRVRGRRRGSAPEAPRILERNPTPTLVLYGPEDHVIPRDFPRADGGGVPRARGPVRGGGRRALPPVGAAPTC